MGASKGNGDRARSQAKAPAHGFKLRNPHAAEFRAAHAKIAKTERNIGLLEIELGQEPGACGIRRKEFHHGDEVRLDAVVLGALLPDTAVAQQLLAIVVVKSFIDVSFS